MSTGGGAGPLVPTFNGFVHNSMDGLVLFEACLSGKLHHVPRRPHDRERASLIKSGSIFIYEENASGIKRWTDGVAWSPSRILGNFLIYRELEKPFPPGEKKRAMKRKRESLPGEPYPRRLSEEDGTGDLNTPLTPPEQSVDGDVKSGLPSDQEKELERSLIGSLVDSYGFRPDGLVKKTMSISINGISHHMVSYYKVDDVKNNKLQRPLSDSRLQNMTVRPELYLKQNFRAPVEETEQYAIDGQMHAYPQMMYSSMGAGAYNVRPGQYMAQPYPMYPLNTTSGPNMYGGLTGTAWPSQPTAAGAMAYASHPGYSTQGYGANYYKGAAGQSGAPAVKAEDSQASAHNSMYGNQYASSYSSMPRSSTQGTPSMMQSAYHTPVQPATSTFGSMTVQGNRTSHGGNTMPSPSTNNQSQHGYTTSTSQPYAVRSPTQSYVMHSAPNSGVPQSPHTGIKSPHSAHPGTSAPDGSAHLHSSHMPYRAGLYGAPHTPQSAHPAHPGSDMNGLGISSTAGYSSQSQNGQNYQSYGHSGQAYRPSGQLAAAHGATQYQQ
ncbi:hypothetical protein LTR36_009423 [Oleoguttula mirabilis]|uniref:Uncharacterized protein n=1 Tax=Oleoguttula mirabilis TaxID=1507867 RepID=A0AAV9JV92_9PEZI|nr:hypothetical protein LTR36_009423 [Oleoguttula mirabilis]